MSRVWARRDMNRATQRAARTVVEQLESRLLLTAAANVPAWTFEGPSPITAGQSIIAPANNNPVVGSVTAIAVNNLLPDIGFIGTANGGIWRTQSLTSEPPIWTPLIDNRLSLSIGSISISPLDADGNAITAATPLNKLVVYAGIARLSSGSRQGGTARGILKSSDGGAHWKSLSVNQLYGLEINSIVPTTLSSGNVVLIAATSQDASSRRVGIWRSTDGGGTFTQLTTDSGLPKGAVNQVIADPSDPQVFYAGVPKKGVYRSADGGVTWKAVNTGIDLITANGADDDRDGTVNNPEESIAGTLRIMLAVHYNAAANTHAVYAALISSKTKKLMGVFRSADPTTGWTKLGAGLVPDINPGKQGSIHFSMVADPDNVNVVYIGGDRQANAPFVGNIFKGDAAAAAGHEWDTELDQAGSAGTAPHADSRSMVFDSNKNIIETDDGGIYRLHSPANTNASLRFWTALNGSSLANTEFYSVAYDSLTKTLIGGAQDVGDPQQNSGGSLFWTDNQQGDGAIVQVDNSNAAFSYRYESNPQLQDLERLKYDSAGNLLERLTIKLPIPGSNGLTLNEKGGTQKIGNDYYFDNTLQFIQPFAINAIDPTRMLIGTQYLYEATNPVVNATNNTLTYTVTPLGGNQLTNLNGDGNDDDGDGADDPAATGNEWAPNVRNWVGMVTAIVYGGVSGGVKNADVAWIGTAQGDLRLRTTAGGAFDKVPAYKRSFGWIRDIVVDPSDWKRAYVISNTGVYFTPDRGATFTNITGKLNQLTSDLRTVELYVKNGTDYVMVGGRSGVFITNDAGAHWRAMGSNLPNALAMDLRYNATDDVLTLGTFGRGAWEMTGAAARIANAAAQPPVVHSAVSPGSPTLKLTQTLPNPDPGVLEVDGDENGPANDNIRLVLDAENPSYLDVFLNNTTPDPTYQVELAAIQKIVVNGLQGDDTLTIDDANGQVSVPDGIVFDQTGPGTNTQNEINQTPIAADAVTAIKNGLQALVDFGQKLAAFGQAAQKLPGVGVSIADALNIGDGSSPIAGLFQQGLVAHVLDYLNNTVTPTAQGLTQILKGLTNPIGNVSFAIDPDSVSGGIFTNARGKQELRFDLSIDALGVLQNLGLDFGTDLSSLGLSLDASAKVDLSAELKFDFSFGYDLTPNLSPADAFFIRVKDLTATASISAGQIPPGNDIGAAGDGGDGGDEGDNEGGAASPQFTSAPIHAKLKLGFLSAQIYNGAIALDAGLSINFNNPDNDPLDNITLSELSGTSLSSLISIDVNGTLDSEFPVKVSLAGLNSADTPVIKISSDDLFGSVPDVSTEGFDQLLNFNNINAAQIVSLVRQLGDAMGSLGKSSAFDVSIPLTSKTLGDVLDFASTATKKLTDPLVDSGGQPKFSSAQDLAQLLATELGLDPSIVNANFDPATNDLTYHVSFAESYDPATVGLNLGLNLSPLGSLTSSTNLTLSASAGADFTFGINLSPLGPGESFADHFFIQDASLSGSLNIDAANIQAQAKIGFLGVGVDNGDGSLTANASIALVNPGGAPAAPTLQGAQGTTPNPTRITLPTLTSTLLSNPSSLIGSTTGGSFMPGVSVDVSQQSGNQVEPSIAIDPTNPQHLFIVSNDSKAGSMTASYSTDGGATWTSRKVGTGPTTGGGDGFEFACCDGSAVFDQFGNLYFSYLNNNHNKVTVLLSTDGGQTFQSTPIATFSASDLDRTALATGPGDQPGSAAVYVAYYEDSVGVHVAGLRATGQGAANIGTFSTPTTLTGTANDNFPEIAVGPKGQVLVTVQAAGGNAEGPSTINVFLDPDGLGPQDFGTKQLVSSTNVGPADKIPAQPDRKITAAAGIAYALSGSHIGRVYEVYTVENPDESDDTDIVVRYSDKDGAAGSWSAPVAVSHDKSKHSQFMPAIAVDPKTGNIAVSWYDSRNDAANHNVELWAAVSTDGGASFTNETKVSAGASDESKATPIGPVEGDDIDYGDYTGLVFFGGTFYPAWADNSTIADGRFDIYTAKVNIGATPVAHSLAPVTHAQSTGINFTGSANLNLPISVTPAGFLNLTNAAVVVDWPDLSDASSLSVSTQNLDDALNFQGLNFDNIIAALQGVVDYLKSLEGFGFLNQKLPLVNVSVSGLLDYAKQFGDKLQAFEANPAGSVQELSDAIQSAFGIPLTLSVDGKNLKMQLDFKSQINANQALNFDLASLLTHASGDLAQLANVLNISGSANLGFTLNSDLNLDLGIDLTDPQNPKPFIYDGTGPGATHFALDASLNATIPNLTVSIGVLSASITNGSATLHGTNAADPAHFGVTLADNDSNGKHYFSENLLNDVSVNLDGAVDVDLPLSVTFPTPQTLTPDLTVTIPDLAALFRGDANSVQVQAPDLSSLIGNLDLLNNSAGLIDGFDQLLGLLQTALNNKAFSHDLPLVGTHLQDGAQVISDFRNDVISKLKTAVSADKSADGVRQALFNVLGPSDLNVLGDLDNSTTITIADIQVVKDDPTNPSNIQFNFKLHRPPKVIAAPVNFDIGLPALSLSTTGTVQVQAGFDFNVGIGINRDKGVYFDTSATNELTINFGIGLQGFSGTGNLGFLQVDVQDDAAHPTVFNGTFAVDLIDPDNKLTIGELGNASIDAHLTANANVNLDTTVSFGGSAEFPSMDAMLHVGWNFNSDTASGSFGDAPQVSFENIRMKLGSFFSAFAGPVLSEIQTVLSPLQPVIDFLNTELTPLEKIDSVRDFFDQNGDHKVFVKEVIEALDPSPVLDFIDAVGALNNIISAASMFNSSTAELNLGRFDLNNVDLRSVSDVSTVPLTDFTEADVNSQLQATAPQFASALADPKLGSAAGAGGGKFELPLLQSPSKVFKLFLGQDVDLFKWTMPALDLKLDIHKEFPLLGPIDITFGGSIHVHAQFGFGYDTTGLREYRKNHYQHISDVADGFYLVDKPDGATSDPAEISATGKISIGAGFDVLIASASVEGSLVGTLDLNLADPNNDGKVRLGELEQELQLGPLCIFDISGSLGLQFSAHASFGVWPAEDDFDYDSPIINLLSFEHDCKSSGTQSDPVLATDIGGGVLRLNMGPYAAQRLTVNTTDGDENFTVSPDPNVPGGIIVSAFGYTQAFTGITSIFADGGNGNDTITIDPTLNVTGTLVGGPGNDTISAGAGSTTIVGDDVANTASGDDVLTGGPANDSIFAGMGNDVVHGGGGNDTINGADGNDSLYGEDGNDSLIGGAGDDLLVGGDGNDTMAGNDGSDQLEGDAGNDVLNGGANDDVLLGGDDNDQLTGGDGNDQLTGGAGNDSLDGGAGADSLDGGDGNDSLTGGADNDVLVGDAGNDSLFGNDGADSISGGDGADSIDGGAGNDSITGDAGNDSIAGGDGNDSIDGGADNDQIDAGAGNDSVLGGTGNDSIIGGDGNDSIQAGDGNDTVFAGNGNDSVYGGTGDDYIDGGTGADLLHGQEGNDTILGQDDPDQIFGDAGNDTIFGNGGNDYIEGGAGQDSISGGDGADSIYGNAGDDIIHGDNDNDFIRGGDGNDIAFGDSGNDSIAGDAGNDILFGDSGQVTLSAANVVVRIQTTNPAIGGNDSIDGGDGADTAFGGAGNDIVIGGTTDNADDILFGDNGAVVLADGTADANAIFSTDPDNGGIDSITGGGGNDILVGGSGGADSSDPITGVGAGDNLDGGSGDNIIIGDDARIDRNAALQITQIQTTFPDHGGNDSITAGAGNDIVFGGFGADSINAGDGNNIILGDNGLLSYTFNGGPAALALITTNNPTLGYSDSITAGAGNDSIFGGTGAESIHGGNGNDLIFGDHGKIDYSLPANANFVSVDTGANAGGGNDSIFGDDGDDIILGGQGSDIIRGGTGDDDLIGGHNVAGADASDSIDGGDGNDVIVGDDGSIVRQSDNSSPRFRALTGTTLYNNANDAAVTAASQIDPAGAKGRTVTILDNTATTSASDYGNDSLAGGSGNDSVFGGLGNDVIQGDASIDQIASTTAPSVLSPTDGDDYIEGGGGADLIFGDGGQDDIIGGNSDLFGLTSAPLRPDGADIIFGGAGTLIARNDPGDTSPAGHASDSDYILGDNGDIFRIVGTTGISTGHFLSFNYDNYSLAKIVVRATRLLDYTAGTGASSTGGDDIIHGEAGDDFIYGEVGNDILFGEGQDDDLYGGANNDRMYGGTGEDGMLGDDGLMFTSRNGLTEPLYGITSINASTDITLPGGQTGVWTFITGRLNKMPRLIAPTSGGNDLMYGGLGDDFMHGGAGDDAMSGAEAQSQWYNSLPAGASFFSGFSVADPTNPLGYNPTTTKFAAFDNSSSTSPMKKINGFFLNFDAVDGSGNKISDGKDRLFGDNGNDWLVGGTMNDRLFGGAGDDVMNLDDNLDTDNGLNDRPDPTPFADDDFAFGGIGRDAMIANTGGDRMYDWSGEYNSYFVPYSRFGEPDVNRNASPTLISFLTALGIESGSDRTLTEPNGELGLSSTGDKGGPRDPQPGNTPGGGYDTSGGPEDDRSTALPLTSTSAKPAMSFASTSASAATTLTTASPLVAFHSMHQTNQTVTVLSDDDTTWLSKNQRYVIHLRIGHHHNVRPRHHHQMPYRAWS